MAWEQLTEITGFPAAESRDIATSPSGDYIAIAYDGYGIWIGEISGRFESVSEVHHLRENTTFYSVEFSPDNKYVAAGWLGDIFIWEVETGHLVRRTDGEGGGVYYSIYYDDLIVTTGTPDGYQITAYDNDPKIYPFEWEISNIDSEDKLSSDIGNDRNTFYTAGTSDIDRIDTTTDPWSYVDSFGHTDLDTHDIVGLGVGRDYVLAAPNTAHAVVFNESDQSYSATLTDPTSDVTDAEVITGSGIVSCSDGNVYVYDLSDSSLMQTLSHSGSITTVDFETNSQVILSASNNGSVYVNSAEIGPAFFEVSITGTNDPVDRGSQFKAYYAVENVGSNAGTKTVELEIRGEIPNGYGFNYGFEYGTKNEYQETVYDSEQHTIESGEAVSSSLTWDTTQYGEYTAVVMSEDNEAHRQITISDAKDLSGVMTFDARTEANYTTGDAVSMSGSASISAIASGTADYSFGTAYDFEGTANLSANASGESVRVRDFFGDTTTFSAESSSDPIRARNFDGSVNMELASTGDLDVRFYDPDLSEIVPITVIDTFHHHEAQRVTTRHSLESAAVVTTTPRESYND